MQLKIQRSQRTGGFGGRTVYFALDVQADYSRTEQDSISKYKLGKEVVYNSKAAQRHFDKADAATDGSVAGGLKGIASGLMARMHLVVTIESLGKGQHIECKDLAELIEAEDAIMAACKNLKGFLQVAATFDGSITLVDFDQEQPIHRSSGMPDLARHAPAQVPSAPPPAQLAPPTPIEPGPQPEPAPVRSTIADQPMRPPMRPGPSSEPEHVSLLDRLDDESKSKLMRGVVAAIAACVILYVLGHL